MSPGDSPRAPEWLDRSLFPFRLRDVRLPAGRMAYVDEGAGETVLLVHGTPGWSFEYREVISRLAGSHRVVAPDHLGFGLSDRLPDGDYTVAAHGRRLGDFLERLDLRGVHMVVHDFGGPVGLSAALDHLDRIEAVTVLNSWMWSLAGDPFFERARLLTGRVGRFLYERLNLSARFLVPRGFVGAGPPPRVHGHYVAAQDREARTAAFAFARELLGAEEALSRLWASREELAPRIRAVVWGMEDTLLPPGRLLPRWRDAVPDAPVVELEGVGHYPQEEAPSRVVAVVRDGP